MAEQNTKSSGPIIHCLLTLLCSMTVTAQQCENIRVSVIELHGSLLVSTIVIRLKEKYRVVAARAFRNVKLGRRNVVVVQFRFRI